jgi:hypothetical protein
LQGQQQLGQIFVLLLSYKIYMEISCRTRLNDMADPIASSRRRKKKETEKSL